MNSKYSIRLYEIFKSYLHLSYHEFEIEELKEILFTTNYINFKDFRVKVLEKALSEINEYTDIEVTYKAIRKGRGGKVSSVLFQFKNKNATERLISYQRVCEILDSRNTNTSDDDNDDFNNDQNDYEDINVLNVISNEDRQMSFANVG
jgi:plasmid replication initiation protein